MDLRWKLKQGLRHFGYDLIEFTLVTSAVTRRQRLFEHYGIDLVLDVGANVGQYGLSLRRNGYRGRIVSFEPLAAAFQELQREAERDHNWETVNLALGQQDGMAELNIASNSVSSSLLDLLPLHQTVLPQAAFIGKESVRLNRLDTIYSSYVRPHDRVFLKLDVQGMERMVLAGVDESLAQIGGIQIEMSLVPLYRDSADFSEMIALLKTYGFQLMSMEPVLVNPLSGQVLEFDGIFFRE